MPGLSLLLEQRAARIKRLESQPKPIRSEHRDYGYHVAQGGKFSKGEISTQLLHAGSTPRSWSRTRRSRWAGRRATVSKRPKSAPAPVTSRSKPGLSGRFSMFDQGSGSMDTRASAPASTSSASARPDAPREATAAFDASPKIEFDGSSDVRDAAGERRAAFRRDRRQAALDDSEASDAKAAFDKIDADGWRHPGQDKGDSTRSTRHRRGEVEALFNVGLSATKKEIASLISSRTRTNRAGAPLNAVAALADLFEERRKADKVKQVAISAALAALHRGATTIKDIAMLAESTVRVLVGQQTSDAVTRILKEAGEGALEAALALARTS
ncbi:Ca2-binding protein [Aureococcus anophagefferens]|nr:Ca2-binding protein [Aureococcus anophagefferens]